MRKAIYFLKSLLPFFPYEKCRHFISTFPQLLLTIIQSEVSQKDSATLFFNCVFPSTHMYPDIVSWYEEDSSLLMLEVRTEEPLFSSM